MISVAITEMTYRRDAREMTLCSGDRGIADHRCDVVKLLVCASLDAMVIDEARSGGYVWVD